ncbi:MAG: Major facilitator superfamily 1 [Chloroflexi bacterium]|nr:Major facilitator superfamily 1 [Chloroflexota bacterium]
MRDRDAYAVYLLLTTASSFCYPMVWIVSTVYMVKDVGLNPLQLVLAGTIQQSVNFVFQAPTGALADMYSRRWAVVLGFFLVGAGFLLQGLIPVFAAVLVSQALTGLGHTIADGADAAWIADEIGVERAGPSYLRAAQLGSIASLLGIAAGVGLAGVRLNLPILASGGLFVAVSVVLAVVMPERHFTPAARGDRTSWQQLGHTLRAGMGMVRVQPVLRAILAIGVFFGLFSAGFDQLWQYHLLRSVGFPTLGALTAVVWFGIIEAGITVTNMIGVEVARRGVDTTSHHAVGWALFAVDGLTVIGALGFALAGQFALAMAAFFMMTAARGPRLALERIWMNQHLDLAVRATVLSMRGQVGALAQIAGGPIFGAIAMAYSTRPALIVAAVILTPALLLYAGVVRRDGPHVAPIAPEALATARDRAEDPV